MIRHWMIRLAVFSTLAAGTAAMMSGLSYSNAAFTGITCAVIDFMLAEIASLFIEGILDRRDLGRIVPGSERFTPPGPPRITLGE